MSETLYLDIKQNPKSYENKHFPFHEDWHGKAFLYADLAVQFCCEDGLNLL